MPVAVAVSGLVKTFGRTRALDGLDLEVTAAGDAGQVPRLVGAALVRLPAVAVFVGVAMLLIGVIPRAVLAVWAVLAVCLVAGMFGEVLALPQWLRDLSPFEHVPPLPAAGFDAVPVIVLTAVAAGLIAAGLVALRGRDIG